MKFLISRASAWPDKEAPCKKAVKKDYYRNGGIWEIEIDSLEDLMDLIEEVGDIVIYNEEPLSITIYDTYIE